MATVKMVALAQFIASKAGATALTVTCDVDEYNVDAATVDNAFATAQSMTHVRNGIYRLFFDGDDTRLYVATAKTADSSVDQQHIPAVIVRLDRVNNADVKTSTRSTVTTAQVNTEVDTALSDVGLTTTVTGRIDAAVTSRLATADYSAAPSAADNANAVWDEALAGHADAGSAGALLTASGAASDPLLNLVPGSYASGTAGYYLGRLANSQVDLVSVFDPVTKTLSYYYGDDYTSDESRQQTFTTELDLSGNASVVWIVGTSSGVKSINCAIVDAHTYSLEVTAENLTQIGVGIWPYDFEITLDNGHTVTEITGQVLVSADVR